MDELTEIHETSWLSRLGSAVKGVLVGCVLVLLAGGVLFWNEGRSVKRYKTLKEGGGAVVSVPADRVDSSHEGQLVHVTGMAQTEQALADPVFGLSEQAMRFWRQVEMYQWDEDKRTEKEEKLGGGTREVTRYRYDKRWAGRLIASSDFKESAGHENPAQMPWESLSLDTPQATLGAFALPLAFVQMMDAQDPLPVDIAVLPAPLQGSLKQDGHFLYQGEDPANPQVGDVRISFFVTRPQEISVVAAQTEGAFAPYTTQVGGEIALLQTGTHSSEAMFQKAQADNRMVTWFVRLGGFVAIFIGLSLITRPLVVLADLVPILGSLVGAGFALLSFVIALILSLLVISVSWLAFRPVLGGGLLLLAAGLCVVVWRLAQARRAPRDAVGASCE